MRIKNGFVLRRVGNVGIVVPLYEKDRERMVKLNCSAMSLWEMLTEGTDTESLVQRMMELYDVSQEVIEKDVLCFLRKLRKVGLLEE